MPNTSFSPALLVAVAVGSAIGGVARYLMTLLVQPRDVAFPLGTLAVNILGCFLIGAIAQYSLAPGRLSPELRVLLISGFCGGFTTFSTFSFESLELIQAGAWSRALVYALASVGVGIAAVYVGTLTVRAAT
ncbi:MAG: fluoride efflux transporter CrcB [Gemmatimonadales bacterium]